MGGTRPASRAVYAQQPQLVSPLPNDVRSKRRWVSRAGATCTTCAAAADTDAVEVTAAAAAAAAHAAAAADAADDDADASSAA